VRQQRFALRSFLPADTVDGMTDITTRQVRAARALLGWTQEELADRAGLGLSTVRLIERGEPHPSEAKRGLSIDPENVATLLGAFEAAGIEFLAPGAAIEVGGEGVRLKQRPRRR
jgi:transcriptional regulator with XRE-family HTH domain